MKTKAVIFDLDKTIWNCYKNHSGEQIWAKQMEPPFKLISLRCIEDSKGQRCFLQYRFKDFLISLIGIYKLGFLSVGAMKDISYEDQPSILLLKKFCLYDYFDYEKHLLWKDEDKCERLKSMSSCIFIDDDMKHTVPAEKLDNVSVINRNSFKNWESMKDVFKKY